LFSLWACSQYSFAKDLPDLPEAFDAGHEKHVHYPHYGYVLEGGTLSITGATGKVEEVQTISGKDWSTTTITVHEALNIGETTTSYLIVEPKVD
jgi:hypothetical protein